MTDDKPVEHWVPAPAPDQRYRAGDCTGVHLRDGERVEWQLDETGHAVGYKIIPAKTEKKPQPETKPVNPGSEL